MTRELFGFWLSTLLGLSALFGLIWRMSRRVGRVNDQVDKIPELTDQVGNLAGDLNRVKGDVNHIKDELSLSSGRTTLRDKVERIDERTINTAAQLTGHIARCSHG